MNSSVAALTLIVLCSTVYMLFDARRTAHENAVQAVTNITLSLEHDVRQTIESIDFCLSISFRITWKHCADAKILEWVSRSCSTQKMEAYSSRGRLATITSD